MEKNKPSATASLILKVVLFASLDDTYSRMVPSEAARLSRLMAKQVILFPNLFLFIITQGFFRWTLKSCEDVLNPGFILHVVARKRFIEKLSSDAIRQGYQQIVIMGAGYDTLGCRVSLAEKNVMCFEVDHPNTQELKRRSLIPLNLPFNFNFITANLALQSISDLLRQNAKFNASKKTLVIIEGVLMYLQEKAVEQLFRELLALFTNKLQCIFTFMDCDQNGDIQFTTAHPLVKWWLKQKQEQFLWGVPRNKLPGLMQKIGFDEITVFGKNDLIEEFFQDIHPVPKLAEGEFICSVKSKRDG